MKPAFGKAVLIAVGVALVVPLALVSSALVSVESRVRVPAEPAAAGTGEAASTSSQTFAMTIYEEGRTVNLWLQDLDSAPYLRQTVETTDGTPTSDQLYRFDEQTLYTATQDASGELTWSSQSGLAPASLQLSDFATGPGAWAAQYGPGDQEIPLGQGSLRVTIHSVDEPIDPTVFELPPGVDPVPAGG